MRLIEAVREGLREEMQADPGVFLIGQDIGINGGVFRVTEGLLAEFGPDRVIDSTLAESSMVGVAIGATLNGMRPVVEIQFADFIFPAFNQIISEAARMYYRTNEEYPVPLVIRALRRRRPRWVVPLPERRGLLRPCARTKGGRAVQSLRHQGPSEGNDT